MEDYWVMGCNDGGGERYQLLVTKNKYLVIFLSQDIDTEYNTHIYATFNYKISKFTISISPKSTPKSTSIDIKSQWRYIYVSHGARVIDNLNISKPMHDLLFIRLYIKLGNQYCSFNILFPIYYLRPQHRWFEANNHTDTIYVPYCVNTMHIQIYHTRHTECSLHKLFKELQHQSIGGVNCSVVRQVKQAVPLYNMAWIGTSTHKWVNINTKSYSVYFHNSFLFSVSGMRAAIRYGH
jgi:hypothetical protein